MLDQLHTFPDTEVAKKIFPRPLDDEGNLTNPPCWMIGDSTIIPVTVMVKTDTGVKPSSTVWYGVSCPEKDSDYFWSLPTAVVELKRPDSLTNWVECVTRSKLTEEESEGVAFVTPVFAGSNYYFNYKEPEIAEET